MVFCVCGDALFSSAGGMCDGGACAYVYADFGGGFDGDVDTGGDSDFGTDGDVYGNGDADSDALADCDRDANAHAIIDTDA